MIERLIELSIKNRAIVLLLVGAVALVGVYCLERTPIDAIPDLSENQVIVFADWMGRSPKEVEDQITYPLSVNLQGLAGVKAVRSTSEFNFSMVNVIFEDGVDFYFARERVLERLSIASTFLPAGVVPYLAPDATALGQIFWYTVEVDPNVAPDAGAPPIDLAELRAIQDWYLRYQLNAVPGVAQVATVGGFAREYQVDVDPGRLRAYGLSLGEVFAAVARSNGSVGGDVFQKNRAEYLIRGYGWIDGPGDIESIVVAERGGVPVFVRHVAAVQVGPAPRRAMLEKGGGEAVGGVVLMRYGENPLAVTERVKEKIEALGRGLPKGVRVVPFYDRTRLVRAAIDTLRDTLLEEMAVTALVVFLVLGHVGSSVVIVATVPLAALVAFIFMYLLGLPSNIMSLSGIAISIGVLVDAGIVMTENAFTRLHDRFGARPVTGDTRAAILEACRVVGRPLFFSVMIMVVSFLPVFALTGMEGRMFRPLAWTKTLALVGVSVLAITLVPALLPTFLRGRLRGEGESFIVRSVAAVYRPVLDFLLERPRWVALSFAILIGLGAYAARHLGSTFMPPLDEGAILDMPMTVPSASITEASDDIIARDELLRTAPEVELVVGKVGRAETPTDPAPIDMVETIVTLRPRDHWPRRALPYATFEAAAEEALRGRDVDVAAVAMDAFGRYDATMRALALRRQREHFPELGEALVRGLVDDLLARAGAGSRTRTAAAPDLVARELAPVHGPRFAQAPLRWEVKAAAEEAARRLGRPDLLAASELPPVVRELVGAYDALRGEDRPTVAALLHAAMEARRDRLVREHLRRLDWELEDRAGPAFAAALAAAAKERGLDIAGAGVLARHSLEKPFLARKTKVELEEELDAMADFPGWANVWTQPIVNRIDMLATGVRTMIGVKVFGDDVEAIQRASNDIAAVLRTVPGAVGVVPDQIQGEGYLEIVVDRERAARYGVAVEDIHRTIEVALGGKPVTTTVEGRRRVPVRVRYAREHREDEERIGRILVERGTSGMAAPGAMAGTAAEPRSRASPAPPLQVPLAAVADIRVREGPSMIKSENGLLRAYVQLNVKHRDVVGFVDEARRAVAEKVALPRGVFIEWSGQFEHQMRARRTLTIVVPIVVVLIFLILFATYGDFADAALMMLAVPGALVGGLLFQYIFDFEFSVAVWVGHILCFGLATETGIVMLVYLREAIDRRGGIEKIGSAEELRAAVVEGAVHRLRPKLLTEGTTILGLVPMLWATGVGAELMRPMAAPVLGGILLADEVIDVFIPVVFYWVRKRRLMPSPQSGGEGKGEGGMASTRALTILAAALLTLAGCFSAERATESRAAQAYKPAPDSPSSVTTAAEAALADAPSLALVQAEAVARNPDIRVALERWVMQIEAVPQRTSLPSPTLSFGYWSVDPARYVEVTQDVPFPTKLLADGRAALAEARALGADLRAAEALLREQVAGAYAGVYLARREVEVTDENLALLARFLDIAQQKYATGAASRADVLSVQLERDSLRAERATLAREVEVAEAGLNLLVGRLPEAPLGELSLPYPPTASADARPPDEAEHAIAARAEVAAAQARVEAADAGLSRARQEWLPDFSLAGAYVQYFEVPSDEYQVSGGLTIPVWWPRIAAGIDAAEADRRRAAAELRGVEIRIRSEVRIARARLEAAAERWRIIGTDLIPHSEQYVQASEAAYIAGQIDFLAFIDAQRQLLARKLEHERALAGWVTRRAELERAVGGRPEAGP